MTASTELERRYRRLLRCYPAGHRGEHEDEMIGVLLSAARPGQGRPGLADSASLLGAAARIRLRAVLTGPADPAWRAALAIVSVILPVLYLLADAVPGAMWWYRGRNSPPPAGHPALLSLSSLHSLLGQVLFSDPLGSGALLPLVLAVLVLCRLRRTARLLASAALLAYVSYMAVHLYFPYVGPQDGLNICALGLEIVALTPAAGPRRGTRLMSWKSWTLTGLAGVAAGAAAGLDFPYTAQFWQELIVGVLVAVLTAVMAAVSPMARRVMVLLAAPVYYFTIFHVMPTMGPLSNTLTYAPLALLVLLAPLAVTRWARRRPTRGRTPR